MRAAWNERQGAARDVRVVGEMPDPEPGLAEVRVRVAATGINPGDVKKRQDFFGYGMPYPRVVPHSDGAWVRSGEDEAVASRAGAHEVIRTGGVPSEEVVGRIRTLAPEGVGHIVEVAFDANIALDTEVLAVGGSLAAYATGEPRPPVPFWELLFKNIRGVLPGQRRLPGRGEGRPRPEN